MSLNLATSVGFDGVDLTSQLLSANVATLALMQQGVSQSCASWRPTILPCSEQDTTVDTGEGESSGQKVGEQERPKTGRRFRAVQADSDGRVYLQEWDSDTKSWNSVTDKDGEIVSLSAETYFKEGKMGQFGGYMQRDMSSLASQLNLPDFRSGFLDQMMDEIRNSVLDKIRNASDLLGHLTTFPLDDGSELTIVGRTQIQKQSGKLQVPVNLLRPTALESRLRLLLRDESGTLEKTRTAVHDACLKFCEDARRMALVKATTATGAS